MYKLASVTIALNQFFLSAIVSQRIHKNFQKLCASNPLLHLYFDGVSKARRAARTLFKTDQKVSFFVYVCIPVILKLTKCIDLLLSLGDPLS